MWVVLVILVVFGKGGEEVKVMGVGQEEKGCVCQLRGNGVGKKWKENAMDWGEGRTEAEGCKWVCFGWGGGVTRGGLCVGGRDWGEPVGRRDGELSGVSGVGGREEQSGGLGWLKEKKQAGVWREDRDGWGRGNGG